MKLEPGVTLTLTHDQALVLFEWLTREDANRGLPLQHQAEQTVLWAIEAQLEKALAEPLQSDYPALVSAARARLISEDEP